MVFPHRQAALVTRADALMRGASALAKLTFDTGAPWHIMWLHLQESRPDLVVMLKEKVSVVLDAVGWEEGERE